MMKYEADGASIVGVQSMGQQTGGRGKDTQEETGYYSLFHMACQHVEERNYNI